MRLLLLISPIIFLISCHNTNEIRDLNIDVNIIPVPKETTVSGKVVVLSGECKIYTENEEALPLITLFKTELKQLTGFDVDITSESGKKADIVFKIDNQLADDEYRIEVSNKINATGRSYQALTMAKTTLLQMSHTQNNELYFPVVKIKDRPSAYYRGLMIDLASFYKSNYVHLHFTDYQSYTLPSKKYPKLSTPDRHYTLEELEELEAYSQLRGITIIPEIDVPGHSSAIVKAYPEIFALKDVEENA